MGDCPGWEDNRILDLAAEVGAFVIVSADIDLLRMSPWRGSPEPLHGSLTHSVKIAKEALTQSV